MQPSPTLSIAGLFLQADPVVKGVMLLLVAASVGVWTVVIDKAFRFGRLRRQTRALDAVSRSDPIILSIDRNGQVFVGPDLVPPGSLAARLKALAQSAPDQVVYVRGDRALAYGRVMETMGLVSSAGFSRVSLLAEQTPPPQ